MKKAIREISLLVAASLSLIPPRGAWANPTGFELQAGVVEVPTMVGNDLVINQSSQAAIINWNSLEPRGGPRSLDHQWSTQRQWFHLVDQPEWHAGR
jgi:hypothetical protein